MTDLGDKCDDSTLSLLELYAHYPACVPRFVNSRRLGRRAESEMNVL
jgi:hypothetical protein